MANFKPLKAGETRTIILRTKGPRSETEQRAFERALLRLLAANQTVVVGYRAGKGKGRTTRRRRD
jgi:hypothetical protein